MGTLEARGSKQVYHFTLVFIFTALYTFKDGETSS
jgi:hypothetical protein